MDKCLKVLDYYQIILTVAFHMASTVEKIKTIISRVVIDCI